MLDVWLLGQGLIHLSRAQIGAMLGPTLREQIFRFLIFDRRRNDDLIALLPIGGRRNALRIGELQCVDDAQNFVEIPAATHRIGHRQADLLIGVDNEDRAHRRRLALIGVDHVIQLGNRKVRIGHDGELQVSVLRIVDVGNPFHMFLDSVCGQAQRLGIAGGKFSRELRRAAHFGGANRREIGGVAEEKDPAVAGPFVQAYAANLAVYGEIGGGIANMKAHGNFLWMVWSALVLTLK